MIQLAIVGYGRWGKVLVDSVQGRSERVRFGAVVTRDPARLAGDAAAAGMTVLGSLTEALAAPGIDGIVLATPHSQHADEVVACAAAGKPVLVEKPFTLTRASAERAVAAAERAGSVLAAAHNRRFLPAVIEIKRMIAAGEAGEILHIESNFSGNAIGRYQPGAWRIAPGESPAGGLAGSGIHMIDTIIHLAGPIGTVYARSSRRIPGLALEDTTAAIFGLASGGSASLTTMTATVPTFRLHLFGTKAAAELRGPPTLIVTPVGGEARQRVFAPFDIERAELEAFAEAVAGRKAYPVALDEVVNGVAAFEGVSKSIAADRPVGIA